ncbi:DUF6134 family protein [uncultured Pseudodesulfovibrio sp.]|uniref:DUF6134 family protein n=1 Tax=uncultured Pseudodesulfovibrio sp. TaxID=2035858 RepID=UPI0029C6A183|nr:DUF6134 family protein [uncultured Pseudodesulfovibrio sp.]
MIYHIRLTLIVTFALATFHVTAPTYAKAGNIIRTAEYGIAIDGFNVGKQYDRWQKSTGNEMALQSQKTIKTPGFFGFSYSINANYRWKNCMLSSLSMTENDDGETIRTTGKTHDNHLSINVNGGDFKNQSIKLATADYDLTYLNLPAYLAARKYPKEELNLRILDTSILKIFDSRVRVQGCEKLSLAGSTFNCTIIRYSANGIESTQWISEDAFGAFVVREINTSELGKIQLELKLHSLSNGK